MVKTFWYPLTDTKCSAEICEVITVIVEERKKMELHFLSKKKKKRPKC